MFWLRNKKISFTLDTLKSCLYWGGGGECPHANMEETVGERLPWKLTTVHPQERSTWRSGVRSAMRAASQLPGRGPTDVDDAPAC